MIVVGDAARRAGVWDGNETMVFGEDWFGRSSVFEKNLGGEALRRSPSKRAGDKIISNQMLDYEVQRTKPNLIIL